MTEEKSTKPAENGPDSNGLGPELDGWGNPMIKADQQTSQIIDCLSAAMRHMDKALEAG